MFYILKCVFYMYLNAFYIHSNSVSQVVLIIMFFTMFHFYVLGFFLMFPSFVYKLIYLLIAFLSLSQIKCIILFFIKACVKALHSWSTIQPMFLYT